MNLLLVVIGLSVFTIMALIMVFMFGDQSAMETRLAQVTAPTGQHAPYGLKGLLTSMTRPLMPFRRVLKQRGEEDMAYRLSLAGYREPEDIDTFINAKLLCPILGVLLATFTGASNVLPFSLVFAAVGFFLPDMYLLRARTRRRTAISLNLPNAMDLLVMCMEAGLGVDQAMLRTAEDMANSAPVLSEELQIVSREQRAGRPRLDAWRNMADRVDLDVLRQFSGMLAQSERMGTPIAQSLSQFADNLRTKRLLTAEEQAAKTSVKLIFPLVLFILPSMFVVILGPAIIVLGEAFQ